jgi:hypothetical protein
MFPIPTDASYPVPGKASPPVPAESSSPVRGELVEPRTIRENTSQICSQFLSRDPLWSQVLKMQPWMAAQVVEG